jgi:hypothetical protein
MSLYRRSGRPTATLAISTQTIAQDATIPLFHPIPNRTFAIIPDTTLPINHQRVRKCPGEGINDQNKSIYKKWYNPIRMDWIGLGFLFFSTWRNDSIVQFHSFIRM